MELILNLQNHDGTKKRNKSENIAHGWVSDVLEEIARSGFGSDTGTNKPTKNCTPVTIEVCWRTEDNELPDAHWNKLVEKG